MADPLITDAEILARLRGRYPGVDVRIDKRQRLRPTAGLTGSYFERLRFRVNGAPADAILKSASLAFGPPTRERLFFAEVAASVPVRLPHCYATAAPVPGEDGWVLMEALPQGKRIVEWSDDETRGALRMLAALHARYLDAPPAELPRPFTRDLERSLSYLPEGTRMLRDRYDELPYLPRVASERALELIAALAARPDAWRGAFNRSPETLLHGDFHLANIVQRSGEPPILFDWQFACAGPPAYDLAIFWLYSVAANKRGVLPFIDGVVIRDRPLTWEQLTVEYGDALIALRADADLDAIFSCADAAIAWEAVRQVTYFAAGMETFIGLQRFLYRDHPKLGRPIARWAHIDDAWRIFGAVFAEFESRAPRLLDGR